MGGPPIDWSNIITSVCPLELDASLVQPVFLSCIACITQEATSSLRLSTLLFLGYRSGLLHVCGPLHA